MSQCVFWEKFSSTLQLEYFLMVACQILIYVYFMKGIFMGYPFYTEIWTIDLKNLLNKKVMI